MILLIASKQRVEPSAVPASRDFSSEPLAQLRPPPPPRHVTHRNSDSLFLSDQYDHTLAARNAGVEGVPWRSVASGSESPPLGIRSLGSYEWLPHKPAPACRVRQIQRSRSDRQR